MRKIKNYEDFTNEEINLKRTLAGAALGAGLVISNPVISQINKINPSNQKKEIINKFDSTTISSLTLQNMIGQDFIIIEEPTISIATAVFYKSHNRRRRYENVLGRQITLQEVIVDDSLDYGSLVNKGEDRISSVLKFQDKKTGEILYYDHFESIYTTFVVGADYEIQKTPTVPFISLGFLEKLEVKLQGTTYSDFFSKIKDITMEFGYDELLPYSDIWINRSRFIPSENSNFDIETGNKLTKDKNLFKFDEIVLNSQTKTLSFKFSLDDESFLVDTPKLYFDDMKIK